MSENKILSTDQLTPEIGAEIDARVNKALDDVMKGIENRIPGYWSLYAAEGSPKYQYYMEAFKEFKRMLEKEKRMVRGSIVFSENRYRFHLDHALHNLIEEFQLQGCRNFISKRDVILRELRRAMNWPFLIFFFLIPFLGMSNQVTDTTTVILEPGTFWIMPNVTPSPGLGNDGDKWIAADSMIYIKFSDKWVDHLGPQGPQVPTGVQGPQGDTGPQGPPTKTDKPFTMYATDDGINFLTGRPCDCEKELFDLRLALFGLYVLVLAGYGYFIYLTIRRNEKAKI